MTFYENKSEILFQLLSLVLPKGQFLCTPVSKCTTSIFQLQLCSLSNVRIFPVRGKRSSAFETHLVLHQPGLIKELFVMTGLEAWTPRVQGLPDEKNMVHGLGQFCLILYGKTPGLLQKCRNVEIRLAWMVTRLPPTPVRTKSSKPLKHLPCSWKHQSKT